MYLRIIIDTYLTADATAALKLRITIPGYVHRIPLNIRIPPDQFIKATGRVKKGYPNSTAINARLGKVESDYMALLLEMQGQGRLNYENLRQLGKVNIKSVYPFIESIIELHRNSPGTYRQKKDMLRLLQSYAPDLAFNNLTLLWLQKYEAYLQEKGNSKATQQNIFTFIRIICRAAVAEGLLKTSPFARFKMPTYQSRYEGLNKEQVDLLRKVELSPQDSICRNIFLFQLYCFGMRIGDAVTIRKDQIREGFLRYSMRKTGDPILIDLSEFDASLFSPGEYLFELPGRGSKERDHRRIRIATKYINSRLKEIARTAGLPEAVAEKVSTKYARLTWAQVAKEASGGDIQLIQEGLGHESASTTRIYLGKANFARINELNKRMWG